MLGEEVDDRDEDEVREERNENEVDRVSSLEVEVLLVRLTRGSALTNLRGERDSRSSFEPEGRRSRGSVNEDATGDWEACREGDAGADERPGPGRVVPPVSSSNMLVNCVCLSFLEEVWRYDGVTMAL